MSTEMLVGAKEAARILGMSLSSLYRLSRAKRVPSYSAGPKMKGVRFSIVELKHALKRHSDPGIRDGKLMRD